MSDPATQEWRDAMTMSTGARLRAAMESNQQLAADLAASQADLTETRRQWALDVDALITARQEIEQQAIRLDNALDENAALRERLRRGLRDLGDGYVQADRDDLEEMLRRGGEQRG